MKGYRHYCNGCNWVAFAISIFPVAVSFQVNAFDIAAGQAGLNDAVEYLAGEQNVTDGSWGNNPEIKFIYTSQVVDALKAANQYRAAYYSGIAWLENHSSPNVDYSARKITSLADRGNNLGHEQAYIYAAKVDAAQRGWGLGPAYTASAMDTALALNAFISTGNGNGQQEAQYYLLDSQRSDGGWAATSAGNSNFLTTAIVLQNLNGVVNPESSVVSAMNKAVTFLGRVGTTDSTLALSYTVQALYRRQGLSEQVDSLLTELLQRQQSTGQWNSILETASAVRALAAVLGLDTSEYARRVSIDDMALRTEVNLQLGKNAMDSINQGELETVTSLDLRSADVSSLTGLENAKNLSTLKISAGVDTSILIGMDIEIIVDSDSDDIAEADDNCPLAHNPSQSNFDSDAYGDACDSDIDNDGMPNDWEDYYVLNAYDATDAHIDLDDDTLTNLEEYELGSSPRDEDSDGDGLEDGVEVAHMLDPADNSDAGLDFDEDGLTNAEEIALGTVLTDPDTDGDGANDGDEVAVNRNPLLNEPALLIAITNLLLGN